MNTIKQDVQESRKSSTYVYGPINRTTGLLTVTVFLILFAMAIPSTAYADTIRTFSVTGTFNAAYPLYKQSFGSLNLVNEGPAQSFVTIDTTTGQGLGGILVLTTLEMLSDFEGASSTSFLITSPNHYMEFSNPDSFVGFTGGTARVKYSIDTSTVFSNILFTDAYLTPVPEPATIYMLGLGLLSLTGLILLKKRVA
jgi:hypothetical protein